MCTVYLPEKEHHRIHKGDESTSYERISSDQPNRSTSQAMKVHTCVESNTTAHASEGHTMGGATVLLKALLLFRLS